MKIKTIKLPYSEVLKRMNRKYTKEQYLALAKKVKEKADNGEDFDALVICIAGWIPTHAVVKITEKFRHLNNPFRINLYYHN